MYMAGSLLFFFSFFLLGFGLEGLMCVALPNHQVHILWAQGANSGIIHSIDIHPSRKHTCLAGGSYGTVFAWDLRRPREAIVLSGTDTGESTPCISESDVREVQYDTFMSASNRANISSERVLPAMICSEDGILAVIKQGEKPTELLAENCAINSFDIDRQNPSFNGSMPMELMERYNFDALDSIVGSRERFQALLVKHISSHISISDPSQVHETRLFSRV